MGLEDDEKIKAYLNSVCCQIRNSKIHRDIQEEVRGHIEEIVQEYMEGGFSENEAINYAIAQMGDAYLIGRELNLVHKQSPEWSVVILTSILSLLGLSIIFLIDSSGILRYSLFTKSIIGALVGLSGAVFLCHFDYMKIKAYSKPIYLATVAIMLFTIILGRTMNGKSYLIIGPAIDFIGISPLLFIISLSDMLAQFNWRNPWKAIYGGTLLVVPALLMLGGGSFSALLSYGVSVIVLLRMSGVKIKNIYILITSCAAAFIFYLLKEPSHQLDNLIYSASIWGQGLTLDGSILPEAHTDFIFTYIVYTFGWIAGLLLVILIALFLIRIRNIALYAKNSYGKLLISGFATILTVQFVWNILMNLHLAPIIDMELPFISYGNSQAVISMAAVGLISNIYKQRNKTLLNS